MDFFEEVQLDEKLSERWPNNKLPTIDECKAATRCLDHADPLILEYLKRRPSFAQFIKESLGM